MVERRQALDAADAAALSARLVAHLLARFPDPPAAVIGFCWPVKNEPDLRSALLHWCRRGARAALPVVVAENSPLAFREWRPDAPLEADRYGIPTPTDGDWLTPEALLLPVNAFDAAGFRLGYGGGYFDRTLATLTPRPLAIGVGFEFNRVATIHPEPHDEALDAVVTETGFEAFGSRLIRV